MLSPAAAAIAPAADVLQDLLAVSLTGIIFYTPLYNPAGSGEILDFTFEYLNPAAQRMMHMPEIPTVTHMEQWPHSKAHGTFQFHVDAYLTGEPREYNINYQADGYDNYYRLAARRSGHGLLVSFTDTADQPRSPVEVALREAQAREQQARAEAEVQRQRLHEVLMALPALMATYRGPEHVFELVNPRYQQLLPTRRIQDLPIRQALPELEGQGIFEQLDAVYHTGAPHADPEQETWVDLTGTGRLEQRYFSVLFQALRDGQGRINGVLNFAYDITEQVLARRQVQQLNLELETRVQQRTQEAEAARAVAVEQRNRLLRLFSQAPAEINLFQGPDHVWTLVHPRTQELLPDRPLLGLPRRQALPELAESQHEPFDRVYRTGQPEYALETTQRLDRFHTGQLHDEYYDLTLQPKFNAAGQIEGVMSFAVNVTERVRSRQQAEALQAQVLAVAQRQAQQREAVFQILADTPAAVALLRGPQHQFEYVNAAYQQLFPERQLLGRAVAEALPETKEAGFLTQLDKVYRTGDTFFGLELPMRLAPRDGGSSQQVYYTFTYQAYREEGRIVGVSIFAFDVTEQVQARAQREAERQQLLGLFTQAPAGICILAGPDLVVEFVNPGFERLLPGREVLGQPIFQALPELVGTPVEMLLREVYASGQTHEEQALLVPMARATDSELEDRYFSFVYQARRQEQGQVDGILVFVFEVTAQLQATDALRESEARFRIMADAAPNQVWAVNPDTTLRYANQAFLDFVGMPLEQYVTTGWSAFVPPAELAQAQRTLEEAIRTRSLYSLEHRMRRHDGEYRWLLAQGAPSFYPNGELYGYVGSAIDITDLKQTNEQLLRTNQDLDNFVYAASHDLKQPVHNLAGLFEELRRSSTFVDPAEEQLLVPLVHDALQQLSSTIDDLAALGQAQQTRQGPPELVSLDELTEEVVNTLEPQVRAARARITTDFTARPVLSFARANLRTILLNLLGNSLKYADPTRTARIHVSVWVEQGQPVLVVEDNGLGFDAARYGAELFHLFRRLHTHTAGTGVGLYLVKRIVEANGGAIVVDSQPGEGATFRIRFGAA
ncbi:PAS domain-containing protein (plasmid) [Hymenobacter tibetensis]|uniref:histidine kinase n=1 Tax=Hymenobacter tibetensis TaxID=497967 RepID=A0ABY4D599_9BACT|nr:PAS domain-containing protein [Hymenobacter tibetensis]UOG77665.1 PAS domain-containing protein [Hymenobacter tibetensis]